MFFQVYFTNQIGYLLLGRLCFSTDGEVTQRQHSVLVTCYGVSNGLRHELQIILCFLVIQERSKRKLLCYILCIVSNTVLSSNHVEEVLDAYMNAKPPIIGNHMAQFSFHVVSNEFGFDGSLY